MHRRIPHWTPAASGGAALVVGGLGTRSPMRAGLYVDRPAGLDDYLFVHFQDPVEIEVRGEHRRAAAGTVMIWPPHARHWFGSQRAWSHSWLYADGAALGPAIAACGLALEEPFTVEPAALTDDLLGAIHRELTTHAAPDAQIVDAYLTIWMRELARRARRTRPIDQRMLEIRRLIDEDPGADHTLARLARLASLSVTHFAAGFRREVGLSPMRYLLAVRLRRAAYHLHDRGMAVAEAGRKAGFADPYHFSRQFRRHFGASPAHYRRQLGL